MEFYFFSSCKGINDITLVNLQEAYLSVLM